MKTYKQFVMEQAEKRKVTPHTVYTDVIRGRYPSLRLQRVNRRVINVLNESTDFRPAKRKVVSFREVFV